MGKMDMILNALREIGSIGATSNELAEKTGFSRTDIFADLNQLVTEGSLVRDDTKSPLRYYPSDTSVTEDAILPETQTETDLDRFILKNASLKEAACQARASLARTSNIRGFMLLGETGVGKQTFAYYIFRYMIQTGMISENAPFIFFNCPDGLSDPQFSDNRLPELITKADGGVLFLDEIHTLSAQDQTRLFSFMEGRDGPKPSIFLIAAATGDPSLSSLAPLTRRFSAAITLPPLSRRSMDDRYHMIEAFLSDEASRCGTSISVSTNVLRALLSYECPNNVSQLRSDIQLSCAKAYADYMSGKKDILEIQTSDLMGHIRKGIYMGVEHRQQWNRLLGTSAKEILFEPSAFPLHENSDIAIYELIDQSIKKLRALNTSSTDIEKHLRIEIDDYFAGYHERINLLKENLMKIVGEDSFKLTREVLRYIENTLNLRLPQKLTFAFSLHIDNLVARIRSSEKITNKNNLLLQSTYPDEFSAAHEGLKIIERFIAMPVPADEAGFISLFFLTDDNFLLDVNRCGNYSGQIEQPKKIETAFNTKYKIIVICSSGEGTSKEVKKILETKLKFSEEHFEIITMGFAGNSGTSIELDAMSRSGKILCAISSFEFNYDCPVFDLESFFCGSASGQIQELIDIESAYLKLSDTLNNFISNVNTQTVVKDIEFFISELVEITKVQIPKSRNMGIIIHIACMIERLKTRTFEINFDGREHFISQNPAVFMAVKQKTEVLNEKYNVIIPDDEVCYLTKFFLR